MLIRSAYRISESLMRLGLSGMLICLSYWSITRGYNIEMNVGLMNKILSTSSIIFLWGVVLHAFLDLRWR